MTERNAKKILVQILQQAQDEATSPDPCDLGVLADRFLERWEPAPLPDSETQWGCLDQHGQVHSVGVENEAQARAMRSMTPVRREVGPWTEVPS